METLNRTRRDRVKGFLQPNASNASPSQPPGVSSYSFFASFFTKKEVLSYFGECAISVLSCRIAVRSEGGEGGGEVAVAGVAAFVGEAEAGGGGLGGGVEGGVVGLGEVDDAFVVAEIEVA